MARDLDRRYDAHQRPENDPAYLAHCIDAFNDAMREADALANAATPDLSELADVLRQRGRATEPRAGRARRPR